jgi:hypothetical protein
LAPTAIARPPLTRGGRVAEDVDHVDHVVDLGEVAPDIFAVDLLAP